jgi:hypothetical protein
VVRCPMPLVNYTLDKTVIARDLHRVDCNATR